MGWIEAHKHTMQSSHCLLASPHPPTSWAAAVHVIHSVHSSLHYAPAVPASFIRGMFMLPGRLLSHKHTLTASRHHRVPLASLIRSSFRQAGHFHNPLIQSPSLSVATFRSSFLHSFHALRSPTAANKPVAACFGFRLPAHIRIAAFVSLSYALLSYGGQSGTRLMQLLLV